jgi:RecA-family ATPase
MLPTTPAYSGHEITEAFSQAGQPLPMLVNELLIQGGCTFIVADPKAGKTTVALQMALALTSGTPVFGALPVPAPVGVYYFAFETSWHRFGLKGGNMSKAIPYNADLLWFDPKCNGVDATAIPDQDGIIKRVLERSKGEAKLIVIDPAYKMAPGGLGKDEVAGKFCAFLGRLNQETGATVLVLHHSHRPKWQDGKIVKERNPSFGSQWLIAHPDLMLHLEKLEDESGVKLRVTEDREEVCRSEMILRYDNDTGTNYLEATDESLFERLLAWLTRQPKGDEFSTKQIAKALGCSVPSIKRFMGDQAVLSVVTFERKSGKVTLWKRKG